MVQRRQEETAEVREARWTTYHISTAQRQDIQHRIQIRMNDKATEEINDVLDDDLTQQYEEGYDDGLIPNDMKRDFGDTGDRFYECEHCGAFRMKK